MTAQERIDDAIRMAREASEANQRKEAEQKAAAERVRAKADAKLEAYKVRQSRRNVRAPKWWDSLRLASMSDCRYPAMMLVRNLLVIAVWIIQVVFAVVMCVSVYGLIQAPPEDMNGLIPGWSWWCMSAMLSNAFLSIFFLLSSESIKVILDIAENTFRMADK